MPRRPAIVTQAELQRVIRAARAERASAVEVQTERGGRIVIRLDETDVPVAHDEVEAL